MVEHITDEALAYRLPLPPHKIASRQAQRVLEWALRDWGVNDVSVENARIVVSELVANALTHSIDVFTLTLRLAENGVLVEVWDSSDTLPVVGLPDGLSINGRGMFLVDALSKEWSVTHESEGGKTVWARIAL